MSHYLFRAGSEEPFVVRFSRIRLPENGIWVFLSGWTLVLVFVLAKSGYLPVPLRSSVLFLSACCMQFRALQSSCFIW